MRQMKIISEFCSNIGDHAWDSAAFCNAAAQAGASQEVLTLVTVQEYPCPMWKALWQLIRIQYSVMHYLPWGWSSHTAAPGILDCALAARLGAQVIEKHMALSKEDVESRHSLLPDEFGRMVAQIMRWAR